MIEVKKRFKDLPVYIVTGTSKKPSGDRITKVITEKLVRKTVARNNTPGIPNYVEKLENVANITEISPPD